MHLKEKFMAKRLLCVILIIITLFTMTACGAVKYDPGFYQVTKSNRSRYWKFDVDFGSTTHSGVVRESFTFNYNIQTRKGDRFENCYMIVEFKVNDTVERHTIEIPKEGGQIAEKVTISFPATNDKIKAKHKIIEIGGAVYLEEKKPLLSSESYIEDNNLHLTQRFFKSFGRRYWTYDFTVDYKKKNNTETIFLYDTVYTHTGVPVSVKSYNFVSGYSSGKASKEKPMDRVERIIIDSSMPFTEFITQNWSELKFYFPNIREIYIRDIIFDENPYSGKWNAEYVSGVDFYIGGDIETCRAHMNGSSVYDAYLYDIDMYEKDNLWK